MKVTSTQATATVTRRFAINEDRPVHAMAHSRAGKKVRVYSGTIEYRWTPEGWTVRDETQIVLHCTVLKKDGSPSAVIHNRWPEVIRVWPRTNLKLTDEYAWLQAVVDLLRPNGEPSMMTLTEAAID